MSSKSLLKTKYSPEKKISSFYTQKHVQVSKDGSHIFCQCSESVNVVELATGNVVHKIENEEEEISSLSLSPDNSSLVIGYVSSNIKHYNVSESDMEPTLIKSFKSYHRGPVLVLSWDESSVLLATGSSDGTLRVWDLKQKYCTHSLKNINGVIRVIMFDKNLSERPWIFAAANEKIFIWLLQSGDSKLVSVLNNHDSAVTGMQLSNSGDKLISCGLDKVIILWDLCTFKSLKVIPVFESLSGVLVKPSGMDFIGSSGSEDDSNIVFTIGNKGIPRVWNVDRGKEVWNSLDPVVPVTEEDVLFTNVVLIKSINSFALTTYDNTILFLHCDSAKIWKQLIGQNEEVLDAVFVGEDSSHTAVITNSSQIRIYERATNNCELVNGHSAIVIALANHPSDEYVFGSSSHDNTTRVWKLSKREFYVTCLAVASGHTHSIGSLVFGKDFLVTGSNDTCIKLWLMDLKKTLSEETITTLTSSRTVQAHSKDINSLAISKKSRLIASGSADKSVKIWKTGTLELEATLQGHKKGIWNVSFSPVDALIASASADGTIKLWDLNSFSNIATFEGHEVAVLKVNWVSQGQQLVSGGADGLIKLWTIKNNICVNTFDEHNGHVWALSLDREGGLMVTGAKDSTLIWWRDVTEEESLKQHEEVQRLIEEEQALQNLLQHRKWAKAFRLALKLRQPARTLSIMKSLLDEDPSTFPSVLRKLRSEEMATLLEYSVQWNTKTRNVREAQNVLNFLLKEYLPEELEALPGWQTALEGLLPYTEKHFRRISALAQSICIVDYMTSCMKLEPTIKLEADEDEETKLLSIIPKTRSDLVREEEIMKSNDDDDSSSYDDSDEDMDDGGSDSDEEEQTNNGPVESVEDIRSTFAYETIMTDSDSESDEGIESEET